tara:strand:- start:1967 stop:2869 length:903 start_codon:yes stop_codon:yes gene_type:complete
MKKKILIIGKGSSGQRFFKTLKNKYDVQSIAAKKFNKLLLKNLKFQLIIISSPSSFHLDHLLKCQENSNNFLVEKPFTNNLENFEKIKYLKKKNIFINYNLRELNLLKKFKKILSNIKGKGKLQFCNVYCGSNVKNWRKKKLSQTVSHSKKLGGGCILELSHEFDLIYKFFGKPTKIYSISKKISKIMKDVEDIFLSHMYFKKRNILLTLNLNFLDNYEKRYFEFNYANCNIILDLSNHEIIIIKEKKKKIIRFSNNIDETYLTIPEKIINKNYSNLCTLKESKIVSKFILKAKKNSIKI